MLMLQLCSLVVVYRGLTDDAPDRGTEFYGNLNSRLCVGSVFVRELFVE